MDRRLRAVAAALQQATAGLEEKPPQEGSETAFLEEYHDALVQKLPDNVKPPTAAAAGADPRWRACLIWTGLLEELEHCLVAIDEEEREAATAATSDAAAAAAAEAAASPEQHRQQQHPKAPRGLLSLRDYSAVHTALELLVYWAIIPAVEPGVGPFDPETRPPAKAVKVHRRLLLWGLSYASKKGMVTQEAVAQLLAVLGVMQRLLMLDQFAPMLLPRYLADVLAGLLQVAYGFNTDLRSTAQSALDALTAALNPRLTMGSLRQLLSRGDAAPRWLRAHAGARTTALVQRPGGIDAALETFLGGSGGGGGGGSAMHDAKAQAMVAALLARLPAPPAPPREYVGNVAPQIVALLRRGSAAGDGGGDPAAAAAARLMGALIAGRLAAAAPEATRELLVAPLLRPLLLLLSAAAEVQSPPRSSSSSSAAQVTIATEEEIDRCLGDLSALLVQTVPPPALVAAVAAENVLPPLLRLRCAARRARSRVAGASGEVLQVLLQRSATAAEDLLRALLPLPAGQELEFVPGPTGGTQLVAGGADGEGVGGNSGGMRAVAEEGGLGIDFSTLRLQSPEADHALKAMAAALAEAEALADTAAEALGQLGEDSQVGGRVFGGLLRRHLALRSGGGGDGEGGAVAEQHVMVALAVLGEKLGPSLLTTGLQILQCLRAVIDFNAQRHASRAAPFLHAPPTSDEPQTASGQLEVEVEDDDDGGDGGLLLLVLGLLSAVVEAGAARRAAEEEAELRAMLPALAALSERGGAEAADMAAALRVSILTRDLTLEQRSQETSRAQRMRGTAGGGDSAASLEERMAAALVDVQEDLSSAQVPLRARGVVTLTRLLRELTAESTRVASLDVLDKFVDIYVLMAQDEESYVYLAAVQGLSVLSDVSPGYVIPTLVSIFCGARAGSADHSAPPLTLAQRLKVGEAVMFAARRCGEAAPKYAQHFVGAFVVAARERVGGDSGSVETRERIHFRASCLSNLAEVCALLRWSLRPYARDVVDLALGALTLETGAGEEATHVRRASAYLLSRILAGTGSDAATIMPDLIKPVYRALRIVASTVSDGVARFHAKAGLAEIDAIMMQQLGGGVR